MFIELFIYPTYIPTQGGILNATYQFMHFLVTAFLHVINALQMKKILDKRIGFSRMPNCLTNAF